MEKTTQRLINYRKKHKRIEVYFDKELFLELESYSKERGLKINEAIRLITKTQLQNQTIPSKIETDKLDAIEKHLDKISQLIRNIANNINQIAHKSNIIGGLVDEHGLLKHLKSLDNLVKTSTKQQLDNTKQKNDR